MSSGQEQRVTHLVVGPAEHGVTRCALDLHATTALRDDPVVRVPGRADLPDAGATTRALLDAARGRGVHVHVTDRLLGATASEAADVLTALAEQVPVTVTLHDLPQPSDGTGGFARRAAAYARVVASARGVVVSSRHESLLLDEALRHAGRGELAARPRAVVPLPVDPPVGPVRPRPPARPRDLGVLGYLYPGKGHEEALAALADLPGDVGLVALGRPSDGHEDLAHELERAAARAGRRCRVTGFVPDEELSARLREVAVPVAPHRHLSASGSINTWLSAGRRPLVPRGRYVEELEERCPGALLVYDDLVAACRSALADPGLTWLDPGVRLGPTREETGAAYARLLRRWHG